VAADGGDRGVLPNRLSCGNPSTTERAKAIDFLVAEKGQPIVIPVK
jgi:hypothetical protein